MPHGKRKRNQINDDSSTNSAVDQNNKAKITVAFSIEAEYDGIRQIFHCQTHSFLKKEISNDRMDITKIIVQLSDFCSLNMNGIGVIDCYSSHPKCQCYQQIGFYDETEEELMLKPIIFIYGDGSQAKAKQKKKK